MILIYCVLDRKLFSFACMERIKSHKNLKIHAVEVSYRLLLPYADAGIRAGFPSPAQDYMDIAIDLNRELIQHPAATFYGRVVGSESWIRREMTITGVRTWKELKGIPCIALETGSATKKSICTSMSFGEMTEDYEVLREAVANFAAACARKLREQNAAANVLQVFILTNLFREDLPQYCQYRNFTLPVPTNNTSELIRYSGLLLKTIFQKGYQYKKAGVMVMDIVPADQTQLNIFDKRNRARDKKIVSVMDTLSKKYGTLVIKCATQGNSKKWKLKNEFISRRFTTNLDDIIQIKA